MQLLSMMAQSSEFAQMAIREEELPELDTLARDACHFDIKGGPENKHGKVSILLQVIDRLVSISTASACCINTICRWSQLGECQVACYIKLASYLAWSLWPVDLQSKLHMLVDCTVYRP